MTIEMAFLGHLDFHQRFTRVEMGLNDMRNMHGRTLISRIGERWMCPMFAGISC